MKFLLTILAIVLLAESADLLFLLQSKNNNCTEVIIENDDSREEIPVSEFEFGKSEKKCQHFDFSYFCQYTITRNHLISNASFISGDFSKIYSPPPEA